MRTSCLFPPGFQYGSPALLSIYDRCYPLISLRRIESDVFGTGSCDETRRLYAREETRRTDRPRLLAVA